MRERARTGVFAGWLCAAVVLALAPLTPAPAAAHDQSFSYIDLDWQADRIAIRVSVHRDDAAAALGIPAPESLTSASFLRREAGPLAAFVANGRWRVAPIHARARRLPTISSPAPIARSVGKAA
jgi:hypothetical protein